MAGLGVGCSESVVGLAAAAVAAILIHDGPRPLLHCGERNTTGAGVRVDAPGQVSLAIPHVFTGSTKGHTVGWVGSDAVIGWRRRSRAKDRLARR